MEPVISALAEEYSSEVTFIKVDIDVHQGEKLMIKKGIHFVPAFIFISREGEIVKEASGRQSKNSLRRDIEKLLGD